MSTPHPEAHGDRRGDRATEETDTGAAPTCAPLAHPSSRVRLARSWRPRRRIRWIRRVLMPLLTLGLVALGGGLGGQHGAARGAEKFLLPPLPGDGSLPVKPEGDTPEAYAEALGKYYAKAAPGFDPEGPLEKSFLWFAGHWTRPDKETGEPKVSIKYFTFAIGNWEKCQEIAVALAESGQPKPYADAWKRHFGKLLIEARVPLNYARIAARLRDLPKGEVIQPKTPAELIAAVAKAYPNLAGVQPVGRMAWLEALSAINPDLSEGTYYRVAGPDKVKEAELHAAVPMPDGRVHVAYYQLRPGAAILLPPAAWLGKEAAALKVGPPAEAPAAVEAKTIYRLTLPGAGYEDERSKKRAPRELILRIQGGKVESADMIQPEFNNRTFPVVPLNTPLPDTGSDALWLTLEGDTLSGNARAILQDSKMGQSFHAYTIKATIQGDAVTGDYSTLISPERKDRAWERGPSGSLTGVKVEATVASNAGEGTAWPGLFGPLGTGEATPTGAAWVDSLEDAKLAWIADEPIPDGRGRDTRGKAKRIERGYPIMGGWASPLIKDGKVFLSYYVPSGTHYAYGAAEKIAPGEEDLYRINLIEADDVVQCYDLATGRTLWKRVYAGKGMNWAGFNKGGPMAGGATGGGRVYSMGTMGRIYAVDQETGATVWTNTIGPRYELMKATREANKAQKQLLATRNDFQSALVHAEGVIAASDQRFTKMDYRYEIGCGIHGFDATTGKHLWHIPEVCGTNRFQQGAQLYTHKGKQYFLTTSDEDGVRLIEPRSGRILAHSPDLVLEHTSVAVGENVVVGDAPRTEQEKKDRKPAGVRALRVSPEGFKPAWDLPAKYGQLLGGGLVMNGKVYIQVHKPVQMLLVIDEASGKVLAEAPALVAGGEHCPYVVGGEGKVIVCKDRTNGLIYFDGDPAKTDASAQDFILDLATGYCGSLLPAIADGRMVIRSPSRLLCYDLRKSQSPERAFGAFMPRRHAARPAGAEPPKAKDDGKGSKGKKGKQEAKPKKPKKDVFKKKEAAAPTVDDMGLDLE